jgi:hypothetical protein
MTTLEQPKGNASREDWAAYALAAGAPAEVVEPLTRDELRDQFGTPEAPSSPAPEPARLPTSEEVTASFDASTETYRFVYPTRPTSEQVTSGEYVPEAQPLVYDASPAVVLTSQN